MSELVLPRPVCATCGAPNCTGLHIPWPPVDASREPDHFELLDWPDIPFRLWDDGNPHGAIHVVFPDGKSVPFGEHLTQGVDAARAKWVCDALNAALTTARGVCNSMKTPTTKTGAELITEERARQRHSLGFGLRHDDGHTDGSLVEAAIAYAFAGQLQGVGKFLPGDASPRNWPWEEVAWKPSRSRVRNLVKAGALIAAEIDRLLRYEDVEEATRINPINGNTEVIVHDRNALDGQVIGAKD